MTMTVDKLKETLDNKGVAYPKRAKKSDLEKMLEEHTMAEATAEVQQIPTKTKDKRTVAEEIFDEMVEAGNIRQEILDEIIGKTGCSKTYAKAIYDVCVDATGKKAGMPTRGSKTDAYVVFDKHLKPLVAKNEDGTLDSQELGKARKAATKEAMETTGLKKNSMDTHLRNYLKANGFALGTSASRGSTEEKAKRIKEMLDEGKARKDIVAMLVAEFGHTEAGANGTYQNICKRNEWIGQRGSGKQPLCWEWFKAHVDADRNAAIAAFMDSGTSAIMASNYWSTFSKAKELALDLCGQVVDEEEPAE